MNRMLEVYAAVCLRKQVPMAVVGRCERRNVSEIIAAKCQTEQIKYLERQILRKKPSSIVEQRQVFDDTEQNTKTHTP